MTNEMRWQPTEEENELYEDLGQIIRGLLLSYESWRSTTRKKPKALRVVATSSLFHAVKQADAIRLLVRTKKTDAAMVLLRSVIETYINCAFICIAKDSSNMVRFMYSGDKAMLDNTQKYKEFVKATYTRPMYTDEMFEELISKFITGIQETAELGYPLKELPDLRQMSEAVIRATGCADFGELYFNSYLMLCDDTHASASNIAEITVSPDFQSRWVGRDLGKTKDTLSITNGLLCSMFMFIEKNAHATHLTINSVLTRKLIRKYNRYIEYPQLKS